MTDKPFVPERIYIPTKLNGALKGDKFFETPIDGVEYVRKDLLKEENSHSGLLEPTKEIKWYDWEWEINKEIPFGAKDSELQEATYYIPKGFHAEIDDDKVVIKKGEKPATWSEEDEVGWTNTMIMIKEAASNHYTKDSVKLVIDWLKSLKEKIGG